MTNPPTGSVCLRSYQISFIFSEAPKLFLRNKYDPTGPFASVSGEQFLNQVKKLDYRNLFG